jgi:hypothetical protein
VSEEHATSRRELLKKAVYVAPVVLTLAVTPSFAGTGSGSRGGGGSSRSNNSDRDNGNGNGNAKGHNKAGKDK